jgi:TusA-related sulfurtransferase
MNSNREIVDARGLSCPHPIMLVSTALKKLNKGEVEVLVDSGTSRDNVSRLAMNSGWTVTIDEKPEGNFRIVLKK